MKKKLILAIIIIGFVIYFNSLLNGFVWDDEEQILNNSAVHSVKNILVFFTGSTFNSAGATKLLGIYYKPLMSVCFSIIYSFFGPNPFFFHLFQVSLHIINSVLVFLILSVILNSFQDHSSKNHKEIPIPSHSGWNDIRLPFFLSLIFLVHPINTESVVYVSALQDVLFFFFGMMAVWLLFNLRGFYNFRFLSNRGGFALVIFMLLLSILSKETGLVFVFIIFFYLLFFNRRSLLKYSVLTFLLAILYLFLRFIIAQVPFATQHLSPITRVNLTIRLITMPKVIFFYLKTFFWPMDLAISQHWLVKTVSFSDFWLPLIFNLLFFLLLSVPLFYFIKKNNRKLTKTYLFFFLWFIIALGLHLQLFPLDMTVADRWFYLPMVGLLGMIGTITKLKTQMSNVKTYIVFFILISILSIRTIVRNYDWKNGLSLYNNDIKISKDAFDLENNLGVELFRNGKREDAVPYFEKSIDLAPYWWTNWNNLGAIYHRKGDFEKAEKYYSQAINNGDYYLAYENYVGLLFQQKKFIQLKEFLEKKALIKFPYNRKFQNTYLFLKTKEKVNK